MVITYEMVKCVHCTIFNKVRRFFYYLCIHNKVDEQFSKMKTQIFSTFDFFSSENDLIILLYLIYNALCSWFIKFRRKQLFTAWKHIRQFSLGRYLYSYLGIRVRKTVKNNCLNENERKIVNVRNKPRCCIFTHYAQWLYICILYRYNYRAWWDTTYIYISSSQEQKVFSFYWRIEPRFLVK